jgi:hypothetical protein
VAPRPAFALGPHQDAAPPVTATVVAEVNSAWPAGATIPDTNGRAGGRRTARNSAGARSRGAHGSAAGGDGRGPGGQGARPPARAGGGYLAADGYSRCAAPGAGTHRAGLCLPNGGALRSSP